MRKYLRAILTLATIGLLFYTIIDLNSQVRAFKKAEVQLREQNDSLLNEVFIKSVELGRIEVATSQILSKYPTIYEKYNQYLDQTTE